MVASVAAQLGQTVTLVEKSDRLGGDCLHHGCVPSKAFIHAAKVAALIRRAAQFGLPEQTLPVDLAAVNERVQQVIDRIQDHDDPERFRGYGCEVLLGKAATFVSPRELRVGEKSVYARRFVIATGSRPAVPGVPGLESAGYLTNLDVFSLRALPRHLVVLGGGPIGVELAQAFGRLGSRVTIVERLTQLLPTEDSELCAMLRDCLESEGISVRTGTEVERVELRGKTKIVYCSGAVDLEADAILVAAGRRPNVESLGLEAAGVRYGTGGIEVDGRLRSSQHHIYACGDVCGPHAFTHVAEYQAGIIISNAVFRLRRRVDYRVVPRVTFSDPELAQVGLSESEARGRGIDPKILHFPFSQIDRALAEREEQGMLKLVTHRGKLLGASMLGPHAGELIHEMALAMKSGASVATIASTIHAYPTLAQIHRRTANTAFAQTLFSPATRHLVRWLQRLIP